MAVLNALRRNPVLFVPVLVSTFVQVPAVLLQAADPSLASTIARGRSVLLIFVTPFFHAGLVGMADEALDGYTNLNTFVREGRDRYVPVLVVYLLVLAASSVMVLGVLVSTAVGLLLTLSVNTQAGLVRPVIIGVFVALPLVAYLLVLVFVQFYGHAIVIDGLGAVDGLKRSVFLVRHHLLRTLGYSVLGGIVGSLFGLGVFLSYLLLAIQGSTVFGLSLPRLSDVGIAVGVVSVVVLQTIAGGAFATYSVAFYRAISD